MKTIIILITAFTYSSFAFLQEEFVSEEFKFKMTVSKDTKLETKTKGRWGGMVGKNDISKAELVAYAYKGKLTDEEISEFAIEESGIEGKYWEPYEEGKNKNGFEWYEIYKVEKNDKTLFGIVGKNEHHNIYYLMFLMVPDSSLNLYSEQFDAWLESCHGLK
jgi:hypothetical protein